MKKCPKCGGSLPADNETCNNCGYSFKGKNSGVFNKPNSNISGNFSKNNIFGSHQANIGKTVSIVFFVIFAFVFIVQFVFFFVLTLSFNNVVDELDGDYDYNYEDDLHTCDSLCHSDYIRFSDKCVCGNGNIYYEGSGQLYYESNMTDDNYYRCKVFCDGEPIDYNNYECTCSNGQMIDKYGNYFYDLGGNTDKVISNWENDILSGKTIATVFCDLSFKYNECSQYKKVVETVKTNNDISIYYINLSDLNSVQRQKVLFTFNIDFYYYYPYTFIMKDSKLLNAMGGMMHEQALEKFLSDNGVI